MIQILIADDHRLLRETWSFLLNKDSRFKVVGTCANSTEAVRASRKLQPDILLLDISMGPYNGIEAAQRIKFVSKGTGIIAVTMSNQLAHVKKMLQIGAKGYVTKSSSTKEMINAIIEVSKGNIYICEEMSELLAMDNSDSLSAVHTLTSREIEVAHLIKDGHSSKEIAQLLDITLKTTQIHRYNISKKLGTNNAISLIHVLNNS